MPVKFQNDAIIAIRNLAASRLHEILQWIEAKMLTFVNTRIFYGNNTMARDHTAK